MRYNKGIEEKGTGKGEGQRGNTSTKESVSGWQPEGVELIKRLINAW